MHSPRLDEIKRQIKGLPTEQVRDLMAWLAIEERDTFRNVRQAIGDALSDPSTWLAHVPEPNSHVRQRQLEAMAADPQIQAEIRAIDEEFRCTEFDGLETTDDDPTR